MVEVEELGRDEGRNGTAEGLEIKVVADETFPNETTAIADVEEEDTIETTGGCGDEDEYSLTVNGDDVEPCMVNEEAGELKVGFVTTEFDNADSISQEGKDDKLLIVGRGMTTRQTITA